MVGNVSAATLKNHFPDMPHQSPSLISIGLQLFVRQVGLLFVGFGLLVVGCQKAELPVESSLAIVDGASMTPHYWGEHWQTKCPDCEFTFSYDTTLPKSNRVVCPNCGFREILADKGTRQPLRQYRIEQPSKPNFKRWEVVAIQSAESSASGFLIKRIVGLPGETISFSQGDVLVNGQVPAKNWREIDEQKVLVYDSQYDPKSLPNQRLRFSPLEFWKDVERTWGLVMEPAETQQAWIDYVPWRCYLHADSRETIGPIEDVYFSDQALARHLHATDQLSIAITVEVVRDTEFSVYRDFCGHQLECNFSWPKRLVRVFDLESDESEWEIACFPLTADLPEEPITIEIATLDQKLAVRVGIESLGRVHISRIERPVSEKVFQMQVRSGLGMRFRRLQIFRDVFWFDEPRGSTEESEPTREFPVPANGFFLMGDNVPVSRDSRDWTVPYVPQESILGRVRQAAE